MVNRDDLIAYLLHEMPEAERTAFAEHWFTEPDTYERLQMAEADLLDSYARGTVSSRQRDQIERHLLSSKVQREKLRFAGALSATLPAPRRTHITWAALTAAAVVVALFGTALWLGLQNVSLRKQLANAQHEVQPPSSGVYAVLLPSGTLRGSAPGVSFQLPSKTDLLRLELELEQGGEGETYSASLSNAGNTIWTEAPIHPEPRGKAWVAPVWIPAKILGPGNYTVRLEVRGNAAAYYNFAITQ
jgi:hypothetical protein